MSDNMKKFLELVSKDENLKKKLEKLDNTVYEQASQAGIALAKEFGIELTEADFVRKESDGELSDDELDAVSGGWNVIPHTSDNCYAFGPGGAFYHE